MNDTRAAQESVESAWKQADSEHDVTRKHTAGDEEEESRYGIDKRQPPAKRRRVGAEIDAHTVYTTDEDSEEEGEADDDEDNGDLVVHMGDDDGSDTGKEEAEYDTSPNNQKTGKKRSYWLSKGIDLGHDSD